MNLWAIVLRKHEYCQSMGSRFVGGLITFCSHVLLHEYVRRHRIYSLYSKESPMPPDGGVIRHNPADLDKHAPD